MKNAFKNYNLTLLLLQSTEAATDLHSPSSQQTRFQSEACTQSCKPRPKGNVHIPRGACHHSGSSKSSNDAAGVSSLCSHSHKTTGHQDHFPVRMKQHSMNCFKCLPKSITTDFKTRSWAGRVTLQKSSLNTTPHSDSSEVADAFVYRAENRLEASLWMLLTEKANENEDSAANEFPCNPARLLRKS